MMTRSLLGIAMKNPVVVLVFMFFTPMASASQESAFVSAASEGRIDALNSLISESRDFPRECSLALISASFAALRLQGENKPYADQIEAVRILIRAGSDVDEHLENGFTPLMLMSILGQADVVHQLINAGADVNAVAVADGSTPLIFAVYGGKMEIVQAVIDAGADVSTKDAGADGADGRTALSYAQEKDRADIVAALEAAGAE